MKELIFIMLFLCLLAIAEVNDTIIQVNATPEEKAKIIEQKKVELETREYLENERMENEKRLLSLSWTDINKEEKIPWIFFKVVNWQYSKYLLIAFIVIAPPIFFYSYRKKQL